ncbi:hypothetical protein [Fibrella forsythiae]|uniref:hypothetical protein n=1 Tax=Fibrella forsythiae TaxID=2817061 RepID=UPI001E545F86|nr:hypothetical protein [Fibrella forsythiae]
MDDPLTSSFDVGFDYRTGYGFIQADRAVQVATPPPVVANLIPNQSAVAGQPYRYLIPTNTFSDPNCTAAS